MNNGGGRPQNDRPIVRIGPGRGPGGPGARAMGEKPKDMKRSIGRLLSYIGKSRYILICLLLFTVLITGTELLGPFLQAKAINCFTLGENGRISVDLNVLTVYLAIMLGVFAISALLSYFQSRIAFKLSLETTYTMRKELFGKISRLPISYTDTHRHGDIMSRMTNDVDNVSTAISQSLTSLLSGVLTLVGALVMMIYYSPLLTLIAFVTIPVTITVSGKLAGFMRKYFKSRQSLLGALNGQVEEMVTGYRTVVAYGKEKRAVSDFAEISEKYRSCSISARVWGSIMGPIMNFLGNLQYVLIAAAGGLIIITGLGMEADASGIGAWFIGGAAACMSVGSIQAMLQYSKKFSHPINMIANQYSVILTALAGAERIFELLDTPNEVDEGKTTISEDEVRGGIEFKNVDFSYVKGEPVIKALSLSVRPGQKIALVGATGSGKTTIVNLLTRFYELDGGDIEIDGVNIRDIPKAELRGMIAIVLQDTVLFSDSIESNIRYGRIDAGSEEVEAAAETSMADSFISRLPEGYDTELTESGGNLSQGQRQLLSIARAVLADPKILILDEATSSVDTRTEMEVQSAMVALMKDRTSLIIAHRLSTIRDADVIVVLSGGEIVEQGSHDELLEHRGEYYKLYRNQFAGIAT